MRRACDPASRTGRDLRRDRRTRSAPGPRRNRSGAACWRAWRGGALPRQVHLTYSARRLCERGARGTEREGATAATRDRMVYAYPPSRCFSQHDFPVHPWLCARALRQLSAVPSRTRHFVLSPVCGEGIEPLIGEGCRRGAAVGRAPRLRDLLRPHAALVVLPRPRGRSTTPTVVRFSLPGAQGDRYGARLSAGGRPERA